MRFTPWVVVALLLGCPLVACHREEEAKPERPKLPVTHPLRRATHLTKEYVARIRAIQHVELRAQEKGYLQDTFVDEGRRVRKGQPMFQIQPTLYQAEAAKARAELAKARVELANAKMLADQRIVSPNELAMAKANFERAQAELQLAKTHQSLAMLRAPFDGIMGQLQVRRGSLLSEGDTLTTLSDNSKVWVYFNVSEAEYLELKTHKERQEGQGVSLILANGDTYRHPGAVETIIADFNAETGTIPFRATFANPEGLLRHGETGKVRMRIPVPDALLIPKKATFDVLEKKFVYVMDAEHRLKARPIKVAAELSEVFLVASGLTEADTILLDGLRKVQDGSAIEPEAEAAEEVMRHLDVATE